MGEKKFFRLFSHSSSNKKSHKNIYKMIIYELTMGENFSEALAKQGTIFPRLLINMIKTAELTGDLPETLDDMADYYRETEKTKSEILIDKLLEGKNIALVSDAGTPGISDPGEEIVNS